jgi:hypothetical protein
VGAAWAAAHHASFAMAAMTASPRVTVACPGEHLLHPRPERDPHEHDERARRARRRENLRGSPEHLAAFDRIVEKLLAAFPG